MAKRGHEGDRSRLVADRLFARGGKPIEALAERLGLPAGVVNSKEHPLNIQGELVAFANDPPGNLAAARGPGDRDKGKEGKQHPSHLISSTGIPPAMDFAQCWAWRAIGQLKRNDPAHAKPKKRASKNTIGRFDRQPEGRVLYLAAVYRSVSALGLRGPRNDDQSAARITDTESQIVPYGVLRPR